MCVFGGRSEWGEPAAAVCPYAHDHPNLAVGESSVILLHPPLPVVGVSIATERERQQSDRTLANGHPDQPELVALPQVRRQPPGLQAPVHLARHTL